MLSTICNAYSGAADDLATLVFVLPMLGFSMIVICSILELLKAICKKILCLFARKKNKRKFSNKNKGNFFDKLQKLPY